MDTLTYSAMGQFNFLFLNVEAATTLLECLTKAKYVLKILKTGNNQ